MFSEKYPQLYDKEWLKRKYIDEKLEVSDIVKLVGCDHQNVRYYLRYYQIPIRSCIDLNSNLIVDNYDVICGLMLGDGCIFKGKKNHRPFLSLHQKQKQFLSFITKDVIKNPVIRIVDQKKRLIQGHWARRSKSYLCSSKSSSILEPYYSRWYPRGKKIVPLDLVLTPTMVLYWFLGDGCTTSYGKSVTLQLATNSFSKKEVLFLSYLFKKIDIYTHVYRHSKKSNNRYGYILRIYKKQDIIKFFDYVGKCPVKCMQYKWKIPKA